MKQFSGLQKCNTPTDIERFFQREITGDQAAGRGPARYESLRRACNDRACAIAGACKRGEYLAVRLDKGRGNSMRYSVAGEVYKTDIWGNGPDFLCATANFEKWYEQHLRKSGLRSKRKIQAIVIWVRVGYLWRALQDLAR